MFRCIRSVSIHPLFFVCLAWIVFTDSTLYLLLITLTVFLHECGHIFIYFRNGVIIDQIRLQPFGVSITPNKENRIPHRVQLICAFAGPCINLTCAGLCYILSFFLILPEWLIVFYTSSLFLGLFNLLPIVPLDGGRILGVMISRIWNEHVSQIVCAVCGFVFGMGMLIWGAYILIDSGMNISLCFLGGYILICLSVKLYQYKKKRTSNVKSRT